MPGGRNCIDVRRWSSGEEVGHGDPGGRRRKHDRNKRRLEAELVNRADVFANVENSIAAANGGVVMAEDIVGEAHARTDAGGDAVFEGRAGSVAGEARDAEFVDATGIDERILAGFGEVRFHVADVAGIVGPGAEEFGAQAKVQGEVLGDLPIVLGKDRGIFLAIVVVVDAAAAEAEFWSALQEVSDVSDR